MVDRIPQQLEHLNEITQLSGVDCFNNLRMNHGRYVSVGEQVAIFLSVLSHHSKVRVVKFCFKRSSHTVHQHFHNVLRAILNLHGSLLASPTPVDDECTHPRWKHFKMDAGTADHINGILWNRNERGRRGWSLREEQVLSEAMKRIISEGWKTENGFRTGYLNQLHTYVKQVLPNTDLKPEPHINSRITVWKKNYHSIFEMLKHTGVGLDSTTYMVDATDEQWDAFMKSRATGGSAQSHLNARMPPPGSSAPTDAGEGSFRVNDKNIGESETPVGDSQTGEDD
ncbi:hypothetical protein ACS0TY_035626 [Phlomoides rotata]